MNKIFYLALVSVMLFASLLSAASMVKVTMYPDSSSYVLRTYSFANAGPFTFEPEAQGIGPQAISVFGNGAVPYYITNFQVNKSKQELKTLTDLVNESVGKKVTAKTSAGNYSAILSWYDNSYVGLADTNGLHIIPFGNLLDLVVPSSNAYKTVNYTDYVLSVFGSASEPNGELTLGYAKSDLAWNIDYDLVVANGAGTLKEYSTLSNSGEESYDNADLTLTMLKPNFVSTYGGYNYDNYAVKTSAMYEGASGSYAPSPSPPVFTAGSKLGIWSYKLSAPITIPAHSTQKMVLFDDKATYTKKSLWDLNRGSTVYRVYELNNSRKEVLPTGTVHVFDNGAFVGEDTIDMLGSKASKELIVSALPQFEVEKATLSDDVTGNAITKFIHTVKVRLTVKNHGDTKDEIEVREDLSGYSDFKYLSYSVQPYKVDGGKAYWKLPVSAGGQQEIEYTYTYSSTY